VLCPPATRLLIQKGDYQSSSRLRSVRLVSICCWGGLWPISDGDSRGARGGWCGGERERVGGDDVKGVGGKKFWKKSG
jgi:hypothetical protein